MNINEKLNKTKINLFGNIWTARLVKLLRYLSVVLVAWLISKSQYLFSVSPWQNFRTILGWENRKIGEVANAFFILSFAGLLIFLYFWLSGLVVEWLLRVNIPASRQSQILQKKVYALDEKTNYSVDKLDNLEITAARNSTYASLKGTLFLSDGNKKKTINFLCHSPTSNLETHLETNFPQTNVKYKPKTFLTWKNALLVVLLLGSCGYGHQIYSDSKELKEFNLGQVIKTKADLQKSIAEKQKKEKEKEEKAERYRRAKITDPDDIKTDFRSIGGLKEAIAECKNNALAIREKNANLKSKKYIAEPDHIILYGPPGTGKTLLAKAIAKESGSFFLNLNGNDFATSLGQEFGNVRGPSSEEKIKQVFDIAIQEAEGKTIVALIDEIDHMGGGFRQVGRELQNILSGVDNRYESIIIIATTNFLQSLSPALLRSGRINKKILVSYPQGKELLQIIEKVLGDYHNERYSEVPELFGNLSQQAFINKFAKKINDAMNQTKYQIKYGDMRIKSDKLNPDDGRILFTGADVWKVITREAPSIANGKRRRVLQEKDFTDAIEKVYKNNRIDWRWIDFARRYITEEIEGSQDQDDERRPQEKNNPLQ